MIQRTLCLIGNAVERVSQARRAKILEAIDPSWRKFSKDNFPSAKDTLFGSDFQSSLTARVENDTALSMVVVISRRSRTEPDFSRQDRPKTTQFFCGDPPGRYRARQGRSFFPYGTSFHRTRKTSAAEDSTPQLRGSAPLPRAQAPSSPQSSTTPTEEALNMLAALPKSNLGSLGITLDLSIVKRRCRCPVRGRI